MSRASRKDRKLQRKRATNAAERGLPAPELEARGGTRGSSAAASEIALTDSAAPLPPSAEGWFASRPLSVKILLALGLATLALLGFSLWRTLSPSKAQAPEEATSAEPTLAPVVSDAVSGSVAPSSSAPHTEAASQ